MFRRAWIAAALFCLPASASAQTVIKLKNSFIEKFKDRATIDVTFTVDHTSAIHPASQDGDIHMAGRADEAGMHLVAEIMNAKTERTKAVMQVKAMEGTSTTVALSGAWRLWSEHGGQITEEQGTSTEPLASSGDAHIFEIHPVSVFDGRSLAQTIAPIDGFQYKDADTAFTAYERTPCQIVPQGDMITIITSKVGFNYTEFVMQLTDPARAIADGSVAFADVVDTAGEVLVKHRRMVFIHGTDAEAAVKVLKKGETLHVIGIPRIDLSLVSWRVRASTDTALKVKFPNVLTWNLPYEMIIVAVLD